ncbi:MAG TPA: LysR family transcriptional regulator [Falsiroseomonas sp.]|jgi:DNA-binding transcriptional LysR family regulator|nr:LysR family transcriptional regulator [Falsiroseomonas sp.]
MEFRSIDYLLAVAEHRSLSAAAGALGLSQPALTKALRRLEEEWGATLFERYARGVRPTIAGEAFLRHARNLRATLREAGQELDALRRGIAGHVRIGAGPSWQGTLLPEALMAFRRDHPAVRIQVVGGLDSELKARLRAGELDFVLAAVGDVSAEATPGLVQKELLSDCYRVVASLAHPLRMRCAIGLAALLEFPWILPPSGTYMVERLRLAFRARGLPPPEPAIETDSQALRFALMRAGDYLSFQAEGHLAALAVPDICPLEVEELSWRRGTGIITRRAVEPCPAALALIGMIATIAAARTATARQDGERAA